mmetsp:Transcript_3278/g.7176  ORF Transcript_3278/g.7176 Transcript_3278/m.7176 type:complete len:222 (-) Transcript_3278:2447-3112(-)
MSLCKSRALSPSPTAMESKETLTSSMHLKVPVSSIVCSSSVLHTHSSECAYIQVPCIMQGRRSLHSHNTIPCTLTASTPLAALRQQLLHLCTQLLVSAPEAHPGSYCHCLLLRHSSATATTWQALQVPCQRVALPGQHHILRPQGLHWANVIATIPTVHEPAVPALLLERAYLPALTQVLRTELAAVRTSSVRLDHKLVTRLAALLPAAAQGERRRPLGIL